MRALRAITELVLASRNRQQRKFSMATYIGKSAFGAPGAESVSEWVVKQSAAKEKEQERATREMNGPPVHVEVPFTFQTLRGVVMYQGKQARATLKWGIVKIRLMGNHRIGILILHGRTMSRSGNNVHVDMIDGRHTFTFQNANVCTEWFEAMKPSSENWEIGKYYEIAFGNKHGHAMTVLANHRGTGARVVVRQMCWEVQAYRATFPHAMMEAEAHAELNHPNLIRACDVLISQDTAYIILPNTHGTIDSMNYEWNVKSPAQVKELAKQLLSGAQALHKAGYVNHAIHCGNIGYVRKSDGSVRYLITDMGGIESANANGVVPWKCYTVTKPQYAAPEMKGACNYMMGKGTTGKVDVFAIGCALGEFILNKCMYGKNASRVLLRDSHDFRPNLKMWDSADPDMKRFVRSLVERNTKNRPTASQALQHPWLTQH